MSELLSREVSHSPRMLPNRPHRSSHRHKQAALTFSSSYTPVFQFVSLFLTRAEGQNPRAAAVMRLGATEEFLRHHHVSGYKRHKTLCPTFPFAFACLFASTYFAGISICSLPCHIRLRPSRCCCRGEHTLKCRLVPSLQLWIVTLLFVFVFFQGYSVIAATGCYG